MYAEDHTLNDALYATDEETSEDEALGANFEDALDDDGMGDGDVDGEDDADLDDDEDEEEEEEEA